MTDLTVRSFADDAKLEADLVVTEATLSTAMQQQPGLLAYYGNQHVLASQQLTHFKRIFDVGEARLYDLATQHFANIGDEKATEGKLKAWMRKQSLYSKLTQKLDDAVFEEQRAKVAYESVKERRRMLNDFGNYRRDEMRSGVSTAINANKAAMDERRNSFARARASIATGTVGTDSE
jgi:hypothetical protein